MSWEGEIVSNNEIAYNETCQNGVLNSTGRKKRCGKLSVSRMGRGASEDESMADSAVVVLRELVEWLDDGHGQYGKKLHSLGMTGDAVKVAHAMMAERRAKYAAIIKKVRKVIA